MKKIDKIILTIATTIVLFIFLINIKQSIVILGYLGIISYYLFIFAHVALFMPLGGLLIVTNWWLERITAFNKVKEKSIVLEYAIRTIIVTPILIFVYIVLPFVFAYMATGSTDIKVLQQFISIE